MRLSRYLIAAVFMISTSVPGWAATYYIAPQGMKTSPTANGSQAKPWGGLGPALKVAKGGDTLLLMDGVHGPINLYNVPFDTPLTIRSMNGKKARVEWIFLHGTTRNVVFRDLSVWLSDLNAKKPRALIETGTGASDVSFDSLDIRSSADASNYPTWTLEQWKKQYINAILVRGVRTQITNNNLTGVGFGIQTIGNDSVIANNTVSGFAGDGLRAIGQKSSVRNNLVTDCVQIDGNHADGFQSWSVSAPVNGLVLDGNRFMEWSNPKVSSLRCKMQGIGLFDGFYDNLLIQNNIVSTSAESFHGISVYGARNAKIVNNTVVSASGNPARSPWLAVFPHKNKTPSTDVIVANNVAMSFAGTSSPANRVVSIGNTVITYPAAMFSDVAKFNYVPKTSSGYIDTGDMTYAAKADIMGTRRPQAKGPDRGAFEVGSSTSATSLSNTTSGARPSSAQAIQSQTEQSTGGAKFLTAP